MKLGSRAARLGMLVGALGWYAVASADDVQVPFDKGGKILRIDARLARQIGLFTDEYRGFAEARLYRQVDSTFSLEISRRVNDTELRERVALSAAGADSLRQLVTDRVALRAPSARYSQEARPLFIASSAMRARSRVWGARRWEPA